MIPETEFEQLLVDQVRMMLRSMMAGSASWDTTPRRSLLFHVLMTVTASSFPPRSGRFSITSSQTAPGETLPCSPPMTGSPTPLPVSWLSQSGLLALINAVEVMQIYKPIHSAALLKYQIQQGLSTKCTHDAFRFSFQGSLFWKRTCGG